MSKKIKLIICGSALGITLFILGYLLSHNFINEEGAAICIFICDFLIDLFLIVYTIGSLIEPGTGNRSIDYAAKLICFIATFINLAMSNTTVIMDTENNTSFAGPFKFHTVLYLIISIFLLGIIFNKLWKEYINEKKDS